MKKNYESYSSAEFLDDAFFIRWIKGESEEAADFWNGWIDKNPANLKEMKDAEAQLRAIFSAKRVKAESGDAEEVWARIESSVAAAEDSRIRRMPQRWWAAAAILLLLASGSYFFLGRQHPKTEVAVIKKDVPVNDVAPGGNKAVLTLANGSTIILDNAQNGTLSSQGNIKIIKLDDGQLAYDRSGVPGNAEVLYNTISTPKGGQYQLTLSDGSKVWLNAESSLRFPAAFSGKERKVELTGEGYFEVAHNAAKPFIVTKNDVEIEVLGTHFNVNAYEDENMIRTTLLEGSVKVNRGNASALITPGEQARINNSTGEITVKEEVDLDEAVAWKNGKFIFNDADIKSIMRQLEKWYDVSVIYDKEVPDEEFVGSVSRDVNISQILEMLEKTGSVNFEIKGRTIIVD